jgi:hypothetical protein
LLELERALEDEYVLVVLAMQFLVHEHPREFEVVSA